MKQIIAISETENGPSHGAWGVEKPPLMHPGENSARRQFAESPAPLRTILIADDDVSVRQMLGRILESEH